MSTDSVNALADSTDSAQLASIMSTSNLSLVRRYFSIVKKELSRTLEHFRSYEDVTVTIENVDQISEIYDALEKKYVNFTIQKRKLEEEIDDDSDLVTIVTEQDENINNDADIFLMELKSKLVQYKVRKQREEEERKKKHEEELENMKNEMERKKQERDHELAVQNIQLEQMKMRHTELMSQADRVGSNTGNRTVNVCNLPKVQLLKFSGQVDRYQEFRDNFNSLVHNRAELSNNIKLHYLKGQLSGAPLNLIDGLRVTDDNYRVALKLLDEEYGSQNIIINKLYTDIANMKCKSNKTWDFHAMYCEIECKLKLLENQNIPIDQGLLFSTLFSKLSGNTQRDLVKAHSDKITVPLIREFVYKERQEERIVKSKSFRPTMSLVAENKVSSSHDGKLANINYEKRRYFTTETLATNASCSKNEA